MCFKKFFGRKITAWILNLTISNELFLLAELSLISVFAPLLVALLSFLQKIDWGSQKNFRADLQKRRVSVRRRGDKKA